MKTERTFSPGTFPPGTFRPGTTSADSPLENRSGRWYRCAAWLAAALLLQLGGCHWIHAPVKLPSETRVEREQLVIHCDFELPQRHRILTSLTTLRDDLTETLALATSDEPIHIYLFDDNESFAKYIQKSHPDFPNRRAFFVKDDTSLTVYGYWGDDVAVDLRHEVTHGYLHSVIPSLPLWIDEGIAEYFEIERGQHGFNLAHVQLLIERLTEGTWRPDIERLQAIHYPAQMQQIDYAEAWLWMHWSLHSEPVNVLRLQSFLADLRHGRGTPHLLDDGPDHETAHAHVLEHLLRLSRANGARS